MTGGSGPGPCSVELRAVGYRYPGADANAVERVDLRIEAGEHVAIVGPNGAGKSTLLLLLNGILEPEEGTVLIGEQRVAPENLQEIRRRVGLVFQDPDDQLFMPSLLEDVAFGPLCSGLTRERALSRARGALEAVGLGAVDGTRPAHHLSGGEKRRAALATVLSMEPRVLALDEPSAELDSRGRRTVAEILRARRETLILVTHDIEFAAAVCPRLVVLDGGAVAADRAAAELLTDAAALRAHGLEPADSLLHDVTRAAGDVQSGELP